jgi:plasmid stabilization system protein ParE
MKVKWSPDARERMDKTADFIQEQFGLRSKMRFKKEVRRVNDLLKANPYLGPVEPLLEDLPLGYHSIVVSHLNKMVYYIADDTIHIADFWDTRREPKAQAQQVKDKS